MKVLVVYNSKGGVGKTTLTAQLGVMAEKKGHGPVALIDLDRQNSIGSWWFRRQATTPLYANVKIPQLPQALKELGTKEGVNLVIIDTPAGVLPGIEDVLACADLVLIPTRASPIDLDAIGEAIGEADKSGKRLTFQINGAANRATITSHTAVALSQHGTVSPHIVYQRTLYADAMTDGRVLSEISPRSNGAKEIESVLAYLVTQLNRKVSAKETK